MHLMARAAGVCYGRMEEREAETEERLIAYLRDQNPPHLTVYEHAAWTFLGPDVYQDTLGCDEAAIFARMARPPVYFPFGDGSALYRFNLSQIRKLRHMPIGRVLADLVRHEVEIAVADIAHCTRDDAGWDEWEILTPENIKPADAAAQDLLANETFHLTMSSRIARQFRTHRTISQEEYSQRVPSEKLTTPLARYILPPGAALYSISESGMQQSRGVELHMLMSLQLYDRLRVDADQASPRGKIVRGSGWRAQDARYVLPNAIATDIIATAPMGFNHFNAEDSQGWWHFLNLRLQKKAQAEIRLIAYGIYEALRLTGRHDTALNRLPDPCVKDLGDLTERVVVRP